MFRLVKSSQTLVLQLAAVALLFNALIPTGFMLHATAGAGMTVVLCPDQGALPGYAADEHHNSFVHDELTAIAQIGDDATCAFAVAAGPLLVGVIPSLRQTDQSSVIPPLQSYTALQQQRRDPSRVRGPPVFS